MTSTNGRDSHIRQLSADGWSVRRIARELDLSKSQVHRVLMAGPDDDGDPDPWEDGDGEYWADVDRIVDGNGQPVSWLDFRRWCWYRRDDDEDPERAARVEADMTRQIAEYEARERDYRVRR